MRILLFYFFLFNIILCNAQSYKDLLPYPQSVEIKKGQFVINREFKILLPENTNKRVNIAARRFLRRLSDRTGIFLKKGEPEFDTIQNSSNFLIIKFKKTSPLKINMDESYKINVVSNTIILEAPTDLGIIHGLESLIQLIDYKQNQYFIQNLTIKDYPRFTWRGLLIDVARHFEPVNVIKRNLDAMALVKMNVFHWHLSDDQGFRIEIKSHPELHQKASDGKYYTQEQIKEVVEYANERGIRVIPEIDVPGHATAILTALPEIASVPRNYILERNAGIFNPTLDPTNEKTYQILEDIFAELAQLFPDEYFHIGGDENNGKDWNKSPHIQKFMKDKGFVTNHQLQTYFNIRLQKILKKYNKKLVGWEEILTPEMPQTAVIHCWRGKPEWKSLVKAVKKGHPAILSNGYYIDLVLPAKSHYQVNPIPDSIHLTPEEKKLVLGGEATMWGELVTPLTIDSRIWPRTAAIAERLWSDEKINDTKEMYRRLDIINHRLEEVGIMHIRNRNFLLRSIAEYQENIKALKQLANVCEPLKYYTRNKGGTQYQSYSPFTLFADACIPDAPDALKFGFFVNEYLKNPTQENRDNIKKMLYIWKNNHKNFIQLKMNPKLQPLEALSKDLSDIASLTLAYMEGKTIDKSKLKKLLDHTKYEPVDVELAIVPSIKKLISKHP